jgi:hypothetical protein
VLVPKPVRSTIAPLRCLRDTGVYGNGYPPNLRKSNSFWFYEQAEEQSKGMESNVSQIDAAKEAISKAKTAEREIA